MIISTGLSSLAEIAETVDVARAAGCGELMLLKCTSAYPSSPSDSNLATIPHMRAAFGCEVGLSDHTLGIAVPVAAVTLGATLIEKHVTLRRSDGGVDSAFSLEPDEVRQLVDQTEIAHQSLGHIRYDPVDSEKTSLRFRRSLYVVEDVTVGDTFTDVNVRAIRPGFGLAPKHLPAVLGRTAVRAVERGTPMGWDLLA
jgi:N-acetylneuraminate synthase